MLRARRSGGIRRPVRGAYSRRGTRSAGMSGLVAASIDDDLADASHLRSGVGDREFARERVVFLLGA